MSQQVASGEKMTPMKMSSVNCRAAKREEKTCGKV